ncbi:fumarylacetoacetate hydrolase family protein [Plastoroseomonas arctica]|uniref:Fumarylacetoacetate hydrolase family protein n=1 Tax=Plastoroseomonas arctica TaxID=1509237 RepID=A0AAF1JUQ3_9PROT|nr:fumarylacetoacetate hydrolase family protein [Plastoroseomonas arctica]MBR0654091.1 fumarylacetoacetate hydrolase family protein [Plastoroseomonas arctica]
MAIWVRYRRDGADGFGVLDDDTIAAHTGDLFAEAAPTGEQVPLADVALLAPARPRRFVGLWNNFHEAAAKNGLATPAVPLWFLKNPGCVVGPEATIRPPASYAGRVVYEGELGVVIGARCAGVDEANAERAIFGYTCVNDVTALDLLTEDASFPQWARAKGCETFGPLGPGIATNLDWLTARVRVAINGRVRQDYPLADMIIRPARIIALISREMALEAGDVIACGTSLGAVSMKPGSVVEVSIDGIGTLRNRFEAAA